MTRWGFTDVWYPNLVEALPWIRELGADVVRFGNSANSDEAGWNLEAILAELEPDLRPYSVSHGWGGGPGGPPTPPAYAEFYRPLVAKFGSRVVWNLWNEPNLNHPDGGGKRALTVRETTELCSAAAVAIRFEDPEAKIVGPPIAPTNADTELSWQTYRDRVYAELPEYVAAAVHLYPRAKSGDARMEEVAIQFGEARRLRPSTGVHVTEMDMAFPGTTPDPDKPMLEARAAKALERGGARAVIFFSIENHRAEAKEIAKALR